jgi:hypothetical protein
VEESGCNNQHWRPRYYLTTLFRSLENNKNLPNIRTTFDGTNIITIMARNVDVPRHDYVYLTSNTQNLKCGFKFHTCLNHGPSNCAKCVWYPLVRVCASTQWIFLC